MYQVGKVGTGFERFGVEFDLGEVVDVSLIC